MHLPQTNKLGILKTWDHPQHPHLLRPTEICLEANHVVECASDVVLTQLNNRIRSFPRPGVDYTNGAQRSISKRLTPTLGKHLDRQATFKEKGIFLLKASQFNTFRTDQRIDKGFVCTPIEGTIDIVSTLAITVSISRSFKSNLHINRIASHDRSQCVIEIQITRSHKECNLRCQRGRCQRTTRNDGRPIGYRQHFLAADGDPSVRFNTPCDQISKVL